MSNRSPWRLAAVVFLLVAGLGSLAVAASAFAVLGSPNADALVESGLMIVGGVSGAYAVASLTAAVGVWQRRRWGLPLVLASQGIVALVLTAILLGGVIDGSLIVVAAIACGAIACALIADRREAGG